MGSGLLLVDAPRLPFTPAGGFLLVRLERQKPTAYTAKLWPLALHPLTILLPAWLFKELLTKEEVGWPTGSMSRCSNKA